MHSSWLGLRHMSAYLSDIHQRSAVKSGPQCTQLWFPARTLVTSTACLEVAQFCNTVRPCIISSLVTSSASSNMLSVTRANTYHTMPQQPSDEPNRMPMCCFETAVSGRVAEGHLTSSRTLEACTTELIVPLRNAECMHA